MDDLSRSSNNMDSEAALIRVASFVVLNGGCPHDCINASLNIAIVVVLE